MSKQSGGIDIVPVALVAIGAYFLYEYGTQNGWFGAAAPVGGTPVPAGIPVGGTTVTTTVTTPTPAPAPAINTTTTGANIQARAIAAMGSAWDGTLSADQWNVFAAEELGRSMPGPDVFGFTGDGRWTAVDFSTYWTRLTSSAVGRTSLGLSGIGWGRGMGRYR